MAGQGRSWLFLSLVSSCIKIILKVLRGRDHLTALGLKPLPNPYHHPESKFLCLTDEEVAQQGSDICPGSHSKYVTGKSLELPEPVSSFMKLGVEG